MVGQEVSCLSRVTLVVITQIVERQRDIAWHSLIDDERSQLLDKFSRFRWGQDVPVGLQRSDGTPDDNLLAEPMDGHLILSAACQAYGQASLPRPSVAPSTTTPRPSASSRSSASGS